MKYLVLSFLVFLINHICFSQNKRGIAYGNHSPQDLEVLSPEVSWWYNWSETPESTVIDVYGDYGFDFVLMTWNGNYDEAKLRTFLSNHAETKYILAFNEPNFIEQANMTPTQVAAQWGRLEAIADDFNLEIVGPAVNYCGNCVEENGVTYTDPFKYLDDFFAACPDCRVDYIAVHSYMNSVSALQWYIGEFKKYGKPIWLTEFAGWEPNGAINSLNDQINFMIGAVDFLETDPDVFRYSWFIGRGVGISNYPYIDLLGANGQLTELGEAYKNMPVHDVNNVVDIPERIEAEEYNTMSGILLEKTADDDGFANIAYIDEGDWLEYKINVPSDDSYAISFRVATIKNSTLDVLVDGVSKLSQNFTASGGWQTWITVNNNLYLTKGQHTIRLKAVTDGFNINWFQIGVVSSIMKNELATNFLVYPNPNSGIFRISASEEVINIIVYDFLGQKLKTLPFTEIINLEDLSKGVYIVKAINQKGKVVATKQISID